MIPAFEAVKAIHDLRGDAVVVPAMTPQRYWESITERPELDLPIFGGMGKASSVALGLALSRPDRRIVILDGDGSLLMNLGSLVTIADQKPENLVHIVFQDGVYFSTGAQAVPGRDRTDLTGIAKSAGIGDATTYDDLEEFVIDLPDILERPGPVFVCLKVVNPPDAPPVYTGRSGEAVKRLTKALRDG